MSWTNRGCRRVSAPTIFVAIAVANGIEVDYLPPRRPRRTKAKPGSRKKVEVLARRLLRGQDLWSERDRTIRNMPD